VKCEADVLDFQALLVQCLFTSCCMLSTAHAWLVLFPAWTRFAEHCLRVSAFLDDPAAVPLYEANNVDTVDDSGHRSAMLCRRPLYNKCAVSKINLQWSTWQHSPCSQSRILPEGKNYGF